MKWFFKEEIVVEPIVKEKLVIEKTKEELFVDKLIKDTLSGKIVWVMEEPEVDGDLFFWSMDGTLLLKQVNGYSRHHCYNRLGFVNNYKKEYIYPINEYNSRLSTLVQLIIETNNHITKRIDDYLENI
jgi:hypothetical protein